MKPFFIFLIILLFLTGISSALYSDVKIIRTNPETPENLVQAQWKEPRETVSEKERKPVFSGKIELGSNGGNEVDGSQILDVYTDSHAGLTKPLGFAVMNLNVDAFRNNHMSGSDDRYSGGISFFSDLWNMNLQTSYTTSSSQVSGETGSTIDKTDSKLTFGLSAGTSIIENMPFSLSYSYNSIHKEENNNATDNSIKNTVMASSSGSIGKFNLVTGAEYNTIDDNAKRMKTTKWGVDLEAGYPINEIFGLSGFFNPERSLTSYSQTGTEIRSTILDYGIGIDAKVLEEISISAVAGRIDTWSNSTIETNPMLKAGLDIRWLPFERVSLSSGYDFSKVVSGNLQQGFNLGAGYSGGEGSVLQSLNGSGSIDYVTDSSGDRVSIQSEWSTIASLVPIQGLSFSGNYSGGYGEKYDANYNDMSSTWNHSFGLDVTHNPLSSLSYMVGAKLSGYLPEHLANQIKQEYSANITYIPGWRNLTLIGGEIFSVSDTGSKRDLFSRAQMGASIPVIKSLNASYRFTWNWTNLHETPVLNDFSHAMNLIYNGSKRPFTVSAGYTLGHGSSGVRHDINSSGYYPFGDNFGIREWANMSFYEEEGSKKSPIIIGISGVYSF